MLSLLLGSGIAVAADFDKGREAYNLGDYETALAELNPLAQRGEARAQHLLGWLHLVRLDPPTALKWFTLAADQGHADAQAQLGSIYDNGEGAVPKNYEKAMKWFTLAADQGHDQARYSLWLMYEEGKIVHENDKTELKWNTKYAEQGFFGSQFYLGRIYEVGSGVLRNEKTAVSWYGKAARQGFDPALINLEKMAEQGNVFAQKGLADLYHSGSGVTENLKTALQWYTKAAEQDFSAAQIDLASILIYSGNTQAGLKWMTKAAELGDSEASRKLGRWHYEESDKTCPNLPFGIKDKDYYPNNKIAFKWYKLSAEQGDRLSELVVACMYLNGIGVLENLRKSFDWYTKGAKQGDHYSAYAISSLGTMYSNGTGVRKDYVRAYMWFNIGAYLEGKGRVQNDEKKKIIAKEMTTDQILQAQDMSSRCMESDYTDC